MKIIKPSVEMIAMSVLGNFTPETGFQVKQGNIIPEQLIEQAGRVCYKSEDKITDDSYSNFVDKLCHQYHHKSVSEHSSATFKIICDRGIMAEITRHRLSSFSIESTRYCNYGKDKFGKEISVIMPPDLTQDQFEAWVEGCEQSEVSYFKMLDNGATPQIARSVLPTCLKTEIVMTCNFRSWEHFLELRTAKAAHPQIREIALMIQEILVKIAPVVFKVNNL